MTNTLHKICKQCGKEKDKSEFYPSKANKDGLRSICKTCDNERCRLYRLAHGMKPREQSAKAIAEREGIKTCIDCKRTLPVSEFASRNSRCRDCRRVYEEQRRRDQGILPRDYIQQEAKRTGTITCVACGQTKPLKDFEKRENNNYRTQCKKCRKEYQALWYKANKDTLIADYREENREEIRAKSKQYYQDHQDQLREASKRWHAENREQAILASKKWREAHPDYSQEYMRAWREKNSKHVEAYKKQYNKENADKIRAWTTARRKLLRETDPLYKMKENARRLIYKSFKRRGYGKNSKTAKILGCTWDELQDYLISTWQNNYGAEWHGEPYHIDHIIPLATATTEQEVIELCHYTNLQMLTPEDNLAKSNSLDWSPDGKK